MNFLIDAQLPKRLKYRFEEAGHNAVHTLDLPLQNKTSDRIIEEISLSEQRIVISKDADFVDSILISNRHINSF
ncbi:MAG: DUF5615 family PIN-like protein [Calditrichota bacterium]